MTTVSVTGATQTVVVADTAGTAVVTVPSAVTVVTVDEVGPQGPSGANGRSITILQPVNGDTFTIFRTIVNTTIISIRALVAGVTPSVTFILKVAPNRTAPGTAITASETITNSTTGNEVAVINQPIPVGYYVWMEVTSVSGTVTELNVGIEF